MSLVKTRFMSQPSNRADSNGNRPSAGPTSFSRQSSGAAARGRGGSGRGSAQQGRSDGTNTRLGLVNPAYTLLKLSAAGGCRAPPASASRCNVGFQSAEVRFLYFRNKGPRHQGQKQPLDPTENGAPPGLTFQGRSHISSRHSKQPNVSLLPAAHVLCRITMLGYWHAT